MKATRKYMRAWLKFRAWAGLSLSILLCVSSCAPGPHKALTKCERWAELYPETFTQADTIKQVITRDPSRWDTVISLNLKDPQGITITDPITQSRVRFISLGDSLVYLDYYQPPIKDTVTIYQDRIKLTPRGPLWKDKRAYWGLVLGFIVGALFVSYIYYLGGRG